jgi:hypothetical protein
LISKALSIYFKEPKRLEPFSLWVNKLKSLAFQSRQTNTAILDQVLTDYFKKWEKKNGKIPTR